MKSARADDDDVPVPLSLEIELLGRVAAQDTNFAKRAASVVRILIVIKQSDTISERDGAQAQYLFSDMPTIGGLPHQQSVVTFTSGRELAEMCRTKNISIVYLMPGLNGDVQSFANALGDMSILTVGSVAAYVREGAVLGFDIVSGKPKLLLRPDIAERQHVVFRADMLALMKKVIP